MTDDATGHGGGGSAASDNIWVLIPLAALSIPILAVGGDSMIWVIGVVAVIAAVTMAARHLMLVQHRQRLEILAAQERLAIVERERYAAVDTFLHKEGVRLERPLDER